MYWDMVFLSFLFLRFIQTKLTIIMCKVYKVKIRHMYALWLGFPDGRNGKGLTCQYRKQKRHGFNSWVWKIPWGRALQPIPVFCLENLHGQRSLMDLSPWGCKELDMTEVTENTLWHDHYIKLVNTFINSHSYHLECSYNEDS